MQTVERWCYCSADAMRLSVHATLDLGVMLVARSPFEGEARKGKTTTNTATPALPALWATPTRKSNLKLPSLAHANVIWAWIRCLAGSKSKLPGHTPRTSSACAAFPSPRYTRLQCAGCCVYSISTAACSHELRTMLQPQRRQRTRSRSGPIDRPAFRAARAFYLTLFIGTCFAAFALSTSYASSQPAVRPQHALYQRDESGAQPTLSEDEQCRLVHRARDQCAFIHKSCPREESGFAAYLDLYYCQLPHLKPLAFIILISWLGLLFSTIGIAASDFFCINLSTIATILGMSESMAGVTFLAFGNGSPDVFSTFAAMSTNSGSLAVGELFGAAGFITAVVAGSMALIRPFHVARKSFVRDVGFFVVAAAFSIVFLWDGKLHFWECLTMVLFYIFYVAFVVAWHWWLGRRRRKREKEAAARGHYVATPGEEFEVEEDEYHDDPEEAVSRPGISRGASREDWSALERGGDGHVDQQTDEDEEEEARDRWMSELNSNMRLTRPPARSRKNTLTPVRPSLVGALEFQAVLKSLQKSRNIQTYPMNSRRYSDDPTYTTAQQQDQLSTLSDPAARPPYEVAINDDGRGSPELQKRSGALEVPGVRARAVSANDAAGLRLDPAEIQKWSSPSSDGIDDNLIDFHERDAQAQTEPRKQPHASLEVPQSATSVQPPSPIVQISPAEDDPPLTSPLVERSERLGPSHESPGSRIPVENLTPDYLYEPDSPKDSPRSVPKAQRLPRIVIPGRTRSQSSTPTSPFPRYRDDPSPHGSRPPSIYLPPAARVGSPETLPPDQSAEQEIPKRPTLLDRWWPHRMLPPPGLLISTLFPTIYHWHEKNYWEKMLGIVAAPSVFLLTITLPVVESGKDEEDQQRDVTMDSARSKSISTTFPEDSNPSNPPHGMAGGGSTATVAVSTEQHHQHSHHGSGSGSSHAINTQMPGITTTDFTSEPEEQLQGPELWNRWLLIVQLFLAPLFILFAIYSQSASDITPRWLLRPCLICVLVSLVLLIPLLLTTTPTHKPHSFRYILSLIGFVVSISWISAIASQVVGALKALAVILNMSHAIMGLTIFAVGNSLGDLVADVTVARLGYPVMALSACFGGPMLNILLGIGLSGSYILLRGAEKRVHQHPGKDFKFKAYHIEVENTLIVSGATLLVTLVGLLIAVPMNKWILSKRIGWALIALWTLSTIGNVVLEITGVGGDKGSENIALAG